MVHYTGYMKPVLGCGMYWYVTVHTSTCLFWKENWYVLVCTRFNKCVQIFIWLLDPGFRGSHCDAAMQAPAVTYASNEERDPLPCSEDEELFESRPDAADMEVAISKFMEGMEKEECSGYNALHNAYT